MTFEARADALIRMVREDGDTRRAAILSEAREQAGKVLAEAHAHARARWRATMEAERVRAHDAIAAARARLQTRHRAALQQQARRDLAAAWEALPGALRSRWLDTNARMVWIDAAVQLAKSAVGVKAWTIEHAPGLSREESEALVKRLAESGITARCTVRAGQEAGVRIVAGSGVVDATTAGLVADRDAVSAAILRELDTPEPAP